MHRPVRPPFFAVIALMAMLALALLPAAGRIATQCGNARIAHHAQVDTTRTEACVAGAHAMGERDAGMPPSHGEPACDYCTVPVAPAFAFATWPGSAPPPIGPWSVRALAHRPVDAPVPTLGSRGPPVFALA